MKSVPSNKMGPEQWIRSGIDVQPLGCGHLAFVTWNRFSTKNEWININLYISIMQTSTLFLANSFSYEIQSKQFGSFARLCYFCFNWVRFVFCMILFWSFLPFRNIFYMFLSHGTQKPTEHRAEKRNPHVFTINKARAQKFKGKKQQQAKKIAKKICYSFRSF